MLETHMLNPNAYQNVTTDGAVTGFSFEMRVPYYRGITLSIIRALEVTVDGVEYPREDITITVNDETFTLEEARTVIHNRWLFGQFGTVTVKKEGGLPAGAHHLKAVITVAPSYMPMQLVKAGEADFTI